ncbi:uncharacterized protein BJ212DRAFT_1304181 [Suillus subaureus]|uniref:Uncharacterized protein n=1 Tax=Suillus subaureus TaxID=48587 RepID=A0A9P7J606_9AGAM|nr:uncharacterized protein BJ212DRAFT_1304181 [Suillus subaureus]KAG1804627.1 hypothetical protein BJ212DRAFT_1304181 [Suillus subaureus]
MQPFKTVSTQCFSLRDVQLNEMMSTKLKQLVGAKKSVLVARVADGNGKLPLAVKNKNRHPTTHGGAGDGRESGIVSDAVPGPAPLQVNMDAHIIIYHEQEGDGMAVGMEDGIISLELNDDFAMGVPPGAPGAINEMIPAQGLCGGDILIFMRMQRYGRGELSTGTNEGSMNSALDVLLEIWERGAK